MGESLRDWLDKFKLPLALSLVGLILIIGGIFSSGLGSSSKKNFPKESIINEQKLISVDVSGSVVKAGVYRLKDGARVEEAIQAAGGFAETANGEYISKYLNMAQKLSDGSKVYVPAAGESGPAVQTGSVVAGSNIQTKVNINLATQAELEALPGIGPVTASRIISDRPYQTIDELLTKKVVSKAVFEKIKDLVATY